MTPLDISPFDSAAFIKRLPSRPGVYRMFDQEESILYVGKAKNLKNRVSSYFRSNALDSKTMALVSRIQNVETTVTGSETEALCLSSR
jgi:excinuclease ABC subunit C